ncbi:MAG TPA: hypothetical protein VM425_06610 [Myxococcota bacterium]|nr:hypothetical protein [Myxococcota bacterium]
MEAVQISAYVSMETRKLLDEYVRERGVKKAFVIESALLHHLMAMQELPPDVIVPPRLVVTRESGEKILAAVENPPEPTDAIKALFDD